METMEAQSDTDNNKNDTCVFVLPLFVFVVTA